MEAEATGRIGLPTCAFRPAASGRGAAASRGEPERSLRARNLHRKPCLNVNEPDEDSNEVVRRRIGAFGLVSREARVRGQARIEKALVASKDLTSSTMPRKVRHVKSERTCGSI